MHRALMLCWPGSRNERQRWAKGAPDRPCPEIESAIAVELLLPHGCRHADASLWVAWQFSIPCIICI